MRSGPDRGTLVTHPNPSLRNRRTRCGRGKSKDKERESTCPPPSGPQSARSGRNGRGADRAWPPHSWRCWPRPQSPPQVAAQDPAAARPPERRPSASFEPRLHRGAWQESRLPDGSATLAYPSGWRAIRSDPGTVTAALRSPSGEIRGYLNATPQQGGETLANWGHFRTDHNRDEGDVDIRTLASARGLRLPGRARLLRDRHLHLLDRARLPRDRLHRRRSERDHGGRRRGSARPVAAAGTCDRARHVELPHMNHNHNERSSKCSRQ